MSCIEDLTKNLCLSRFYWWKLGLFSSLLCICSSLEIIVVYEESNSFWNSNKFLNLSADINSLVELHYCEYSEADKCIDFYESALLVLDLTDLIETQFFISKFCNERKIPHLVVENKLNYFDQLTFSTTPLYLDKLNAFLAVLRYFGWQKGLVIDEKIEQSPKAEFQAYSESFNYLTIESGSNIDELVNRIITPLGTTLYYVFVNSTESYKLQEALMDNNLLIEGNGIVLDQNSGYNCLIDGALIITVQGQEFSYSKEDYINSTIESVFSYLLKNIKTESSLEILFSKYPKWGKGGSWRNN
ncbi:unnamed protein product [Blepharisma stoltei]|uniref:Uncharacterized protein n=1 Tax=Blepharisma stoltei TaxID=1481888 RepID=A0AAU9KG60_9CILI|nr:unnamed protein product [Blepharisma stoltei]